MQGKHELKQASEATRLFDSFRRDQLRRGLSNSTWKRYSVFLNQFGAWLDGRDPREVTRADVKEYLGVWREGYEKKHGKPPKDNTARNAHCALRSFYTFLEECEYVPSNPVGKRDAPKGQRKVNDYLSADEERRLVETARKGAPHERFLVLFLLHTGMRVSCEAINAKQRDIDLTPTPDYPYGRIIVPESKTDRGRRTIPILPEVRPEIQKWFDYLRAVDLRAPNLPVLVTSKRTPMTHDFVLRVVKRIAERADVRPVECECETKRGRHDEGCPRTVNGHNRSRITPHTLRRSFGSSLRRGGVSLDAISKALGHSDTRTTEASYVDLEDAVMAREILRAQ